MARKVEKKVRGGAGNPPRARVRAPRAPRDEVERRIRACMAIMGEGAWRPSRAEDLAEQFGCSVDCMRKAAAEASRRLTCFEDRAEVTANLQGRIDRLWDAAEEHGDRRAMAAAIDLEAKVRGVYAPQKVAVTDTKGNDALPLPPAVAALTEHPALLAWAFQNGRPPTPAEREAILASSPKEPPST